MSAEPTHSGPRPCPECGRIGRWTGACNGPGLAGLQLACDTDECDMLMYLS